MKRILMLLTVLTVIISCNKAGENEYIISGTVKGIADGKTVILEKQDEMGQFIPMDTVKVKDGKFIMKGSAKEPEIMLIQVEALEGKVPFVLENGDIDIKKLFTITSVLDDVLNRNKIGSSVKVYCDPTDKLANEEVDCDYNSLEDTLKH
jgi:hypothetical protein